MVGIAVFFQQPDPQPGTGWLAPTPTELVVKTNSVVAEIDERFLSVAVDIANVVGGEFWDPSRDAAVMGMAKVHRFDFSRPRLRKLAAALAPAYLRIGGTDADRTIYDLEDALPRPPKGSWKLQRQQWDALNEFAVALDYRIIFTLNAGALARDVTGRWNPATARPLLLDASSRGYPVDVWELGNELNVYPLLHRHWLSPEGYAEDIQLARWLIDDVTPQARLAGPAVAFWPHIGEGIPFAKHFMKSGGQLLDVITWHYYPEQSFRCPIATNRAHAGEVLTTRELREVERWAAFVEQLKERHAPQAQVWLGETGPAQCGGEPEHSDRFGSSLWWVDELGRMARRGQRVVVRQALSGGNYGLIDDKTLAPNPDYWASLLWRRLMGTRVLAASVADGTSLHAYAHCQRDLPGAIALALINVHPAQTIEVRLKGLGSRAQVYLVQADRPGSQSVRLNGRVLQPDAQGELPVLSPQAALTETNQAVRLVVPPYSYAFVVLPGAGAPACLTKA